MKFIILFSLFVALLLMSATPVSASVPIFHHKKDTLGQKFSFKKPANLRQNAHHAQAHPSGQHPMTRNLNQPRHAHSAAHHNTVHH